MAKSQIIFGDTPTRPMSDPRSWAKSHGTYIAGRAYLDGADQTAADMEAKWGAGRLRLLVGAELREKFDRQRYLFNQAIWHGELESVRAQSNRMVTAWMALDAAATAAGKTALHPMVWEVALEDGAVAAIVPDHEHARHVVAEGRDVRVFTIDEIGRLLSAYPDLIKAKAVFPGSTVEAVRRSISDPLDTVMDTQDALDDPIPDLSQ